MRCFISIDIPERIKRKIQIVQEQLPEFLGKKTEAENLHLTLKFLGEINKEELEKVKKKLSDMKFEKFETQADSIGFFSEDFIRIIWLHLTNCEKLQKYLDKELKDLFEPEKRFMSHLTIARVKNIKDKKGFLEDLKKVKMSEIKFVVDKFRLKESILTSSGPEYKILGEYF